MKPLSTVMLYFATFSPPLRMHQGAIIGVGLIKPIPCTSLPRAIPARIARHCDVRRRHGGEKWRGGNWLDEWVTTTASGNITAHLPARPYRTALDGVRSDNGRLRQLSHPLRVGQAPLPMDVGLEGNQPRLPCSGKRLIGSVESAAAIHPVSAPIPGVGEPRANNPRAEAQTVDWMDISVAATC